MGVKLLGFGTSRNGYHDADGKGVSLYARFKFMSFLGNVGRRLWYCTVGSQTWLDSFAESRNIYCSQQNCRVVGKNLSFKSAA